MSTITAKPDAALNLTRMASRLAGPVLLSAAIGSLVLAVPPLRGVAHQLAHLNPGWVAAAAALELGSCAAFVVVFRLFFDRVPAPAARRVAWLEQGSGALLPGGGVGALAIGGWFMRRGGMSTRAIVERSSALFFLTSAVNVVALVGAGAWLAADGPDSSAVLVRAVAPIGGGMAVTLLVLALPILIRRQPQRGWPGWVIDLAAGIEHACRSLGRPSWRLVGAAGYLAFDIAALGATFAAAGRPLPVVPLILGYLIGYLANLIPVPGGFGVLEGGLAGTLIAYGAPPTQAAAAVVIYHAIAFWIPSLGGLIGYALLRRCGASSSETASVRDSQPSSLTTSRSSTRTPRITRTVVPGSTAITSPSISASLPLLPSDRCSCMERPMPCPRPA